jgi:hypothetical protein
MVRAMQNLGISKGVSMQPCKLAVTIRSLICRLDVTIHSLSGILNQSSYLEPQYPVSMDAAADVVHVSSAASSYSDTTLSYSSRNQRQKLQANKTAAAGGGGGGGSADVAVQNEHLNQDCQKSVQAWRKAALHSSMLSLPSLCEQRLGCLLVATIKMELRPPSHWIQVSVLLKV